MKNEFISENYKIAIHKKVDLKALATKPLLDYEKEDLIESIQENVEKIDDLQNILYAENTRSLLIILQGMDASGKDSIIRAIMTGVNPQGVEVTSFKKPTTTELEHDYLWRHYVKLPSRGMIGVFNRSHYENVLVTKVHPEFLQYEQLYGIQSVSDITEEFWNKRYEQIRDFEKTISQNGIKIIKFMLHISKEEQKERFIDRIENKEKIGNFLLQI